MEGHFPEELYRNLFRAPDKEGSIVSVRVHRSVKDILAEMARREGLEGVSELVRYLIAGYILGHYKIAKPEPKMLVSPIYLTISVERGRKGAVSEEKAEEVGMVIKEATRFLANVKRGEVIVRGNDYARRLYRRVGKAIRMARELGLEDQYMELLRIKAQLSSLVEL